MSGLTLKNVNKTYPVRHQVIEDLSVEIEKGEFLILAGPEGCGKSTLLRMIAGLEEISSGSIFIDGIDVTNADPRERNLAMLFKNSVLYPSMSVSDNLALSLKMGYVPADEAKLRIEEITERFGLQPILAKKPGELKRDETVRALLARALVRKPGILLVDSAIAGLGEEIQAHLEELDVTVVYAADSNEAPVNVGTRMILMNDGAVCQDDTPQMIYGKPVNLFAASHLGRPSLNLALATVFGEENRVGLAFAGSKLILPDEKGRKLAQGGYFGKNVLVGMRPEAIRISGEKETTAVFEGVLQGMELYQNRPLLHFSVGENVWMAFADGMPACGIGGKLKLTVDMEKVYIFDPETEETLTN